MTTSEEDAPAVIEKLISEEEGSGAIPSLIKPTTQLYISSSDNIDLTAFDTVIGSTPSPFSSAQIKDAGVKHYLHLPCQPGKLGSRDLRAQLPHLIHFFSSTSLPNGKILLCCPTGKDLSVGTALAILCLYANDSGVLNTGTRRPKKEIGKPFIKQRLSWITMSNPALNPSRTTLQSVNAVLLESHDPKAYSTGKSNGTVVIPIRESKPVPSEPQTDASPTPKPSPASTIFKALQNTAPEAPWTFSRTLTSALPSHPSGHVTGTATFTPCNLPSSFPPTLLYAEEGVFVTDRGFKFNAKKKYVYQLKQSPTADGERDEGGGTGSKDYISVSFFNDEALPRSSVADGVGQNGEGIGGLFVEMGPLLGTSTVADITTEPKGESITAKNKETHLCAEDLYTASWVFGRGILSQGTGTENVNGDEGKGEVWWEVRYDVKGPKKDYVSRTKYSRG